MFKFWMSLLFVALISGCQGEEETANEPDDTDTSRAIVQTPELVEKLTGASFSEQFDVLYEEYSDLIDTSDDLAGPDEDVDGVRDDISAFIDAMVESEEIKLAIKQEARLYHRVMSNEFLGEPEEVLKSAYEIALLGLSITACYEYRGLTLEEEREVSSMLEKLTFNTKERIIAYIRYNKLLDGTSYTLLEPEERNCE